MQNCTLNRMLMMMAVCFSGGLALAQEPQAEDYNLSMAGALINDWCGRQLEETDFISIHACNYATAQKHNEETSLSHFTECAIAAGGDIVRIADCMQAQFNEWIAGDGHED